MELFAAQGGRDAAREQQPIDGTLVGLEHLVWRARRQSHAFGSYHTRAVSTECLEELQGFGLCSVPQHADCHWTAPQEFVTLARDCFRPGYLLLPKRSLRAIPWPVTNGIAS